MQISDFPANFVKKWYQPEQGQKAIAVILILSLLATSVILVYLTGGVRYVYAHFIYLPILLAAVFFGARGGVFTALLAGISLGPLMPLDTITGEQQDLVNWLMRMGIFSLVGVLSGLCVDALHTALRKAKQIADQDPVTNLPNQYSLQQTLEAHMQKSTSHSLKLLIINIDNYIELFYTFGAKTCNHLLIKVYQRLQSVTSGKYQVYHLQTNKFGIIVPDHQCTNTERKIIKEISASFHKETFVVEGIPLYIEFSTGIAIYPDHTTKADILIQKAGIALYSAKSKQSNYSYYDVNSDWTNLGNLKLIGSIPHALENNQFVLYYQPQYDIQCNCITGAEALVRWQHPSKGLLAPASFIEEIERTALIQPFTRWVLRTAMEQLQVWLAAKYKLVISVNISAKNLKEPDFVPFLRQEIERTGINPAYLALEVTESSVMDDYQNAVAVLSAIRSLGVQICVDDFGTGFSSLSCLKELPVDIVKIDRLFLQNFSENLSDQAIVSATIAMAQTLGLGVTAEGVEDETTVNLLRSMGCQTVQGYFYFHPCPPSEITTLLHTYFFSQQQVLRNHQY